MNRLLCGFFAAWVAGVFATLSPVLADDRRLFDFESAKDLQAWSNLELGGTAEKSAAAADQRAVEPRAEIGLSGEHATTGGQRLKITFHGGTWPAITTTQIPDDWMPFHTFRADVTVGRSCVVGFRVLQEGSTRGTGYDDAVSRWVTTQFMPPGPNRVEADLHPNSWSAIGKTVGKSKPLGKVVRLEIFMYQPHDGESIFVDDIRIGTEKRPTAAPVKTKFQVLGTDWVVAGVQDLAKRSADQWVRRSPQTVDQAEAEFRSDYERLRRDHPRAVLALFREGERGFDPAAPDRVYTGWQDAYWTSHGPDGNNVHRAENLGKAESGEIFMRHRSPLMRVDLSSIPAGADILAARLLIVRSKTPEAARNPDRPNMWVAEPCNRPWKEYEVNAYQYARDRYWKAIGGQYYGDDPDFWPVYLAYGPSRDGCTSWDFTHAVRFWTDGRHENHGFMLHGDAADWFIAWNREAQQVNNRPALLVVYEPK